MENDNMRRERIFNEWYQHASDDLEYAQIILERGTRYGGVMAHSQQAIEKLIKGLYYYYTGEYAPHIHAINRLVKLLLEHLPEPPAEMPDSDTWKFFDQLTRSYTRARYPSVSAAQSLSNQAEAIEILETTEAIFEWLLALKK